MGCTVLLELEDSDEAFGVVKADSHSFSNDFRLLGLGVRVGACDIAPDEILSRTSCILGRVRLVHSSRTLRDVVGATWCQRITRPPNHAELQILEKGKDF